jgi:hypothetical protein
MKARHQIVTAIREILQNRRIGVLGRAKYPIETLLWSECGFDADTSPQVIESSSSVIALTGTISELA